LVNEQAVADYFEECVATAKQKGIILDHFPKLVTNWITGELFALLNKAEVSVDELQKKSFTVPPDELVNLISFVEQGEINQNTAKSVLAKMFFEGKTAEEIIEKEGLRQISEQGFIAQLVNDILNAHPQEVESFLNGKETLFNWLFGQVMRSAKNKANPQLLRTELEKQLNDARKSKQKEQ